MEYIGFIISFLALVYLYFQQHSLARRRKKRPQMQQEGSHDEDLVEYMTKERQVKKKTEPQPPLPPKQPKSVRKGVASPLEQYRLESSVEKRQLRSSLESRELKPTVKKHYEEPAPRIIPPLYPSDYITAVPSRAEIAMKRLSHKRDLIIYQEIIGKPKSMRTFT